MKGQYLAACIKNSKELTNHYSTSFSLGIQTLAKKIHEPIYAIYGFVRLADEIVDTFHDQDKSRLLREFTDETYKAIERKISLNTILHSFQWTVNRFNIERELIDAFIKSMEYDLLKKTYNREEYESYIYGSAEVVGLMCLRVFCENDNALYDKLKAPAKRLGSAFQKINFLRDIRSDKIERGRTYFPGVDLEAFTETDKKAIEVDIAADFNAGYQGIKNLPKCARLGVYSTYIYYFALFRKIQKTDAKAILNKRIRVPNYQKYFLLGRSLFLYRLGMI